jgi:hypothetical protein
MYRQPPGHSLSSKATNWYSKEILKSKQADNRLGVAPQTISRRRRTYKLPRLDLAGETAYRYPAWQFHDKVRSILPSVLKEMFDINSWSIYLFFLQRTSSGTLAPLPFK